MKYDKCPACGGSVAEGSHWDCVFWMLDEFVKSKSEEERVEQSQASKALGGQWVEGEMGSEYETEGVPERKGGY